MTLFCGYSRNESPSIGPVAAAHPVPATGATMKGEPMPTFRRLTPEELSRFRPRSTAPVDLTDYTDFLQDLQRGEVGELAIAETENQRTVKRRLSTAANRMGKPIKYRRAEGNLVRFEVA